MFSEDGMDYAINMASSLTQKLSLEMRLLRMASKLGKNLFTIVIFSHALPLLHQRGAVGSSECVTYAQRLLSGSLYLASLVYVTNRIVPAV